MIIPQQLRRAREFLALTPEEVAETLGVTVEELRAWEAGQADPDVEQLEALAEQYHRSLDYFLRETPVPPQAPTLRLVKAAALDQVPIADRAVLAVFDELCRKEWELERSLGKERRVGVPRGPVTGRPHEVAARERERLGLGDKPAADLRAILEKHGLRTFELKIAKGTFAGACWWHETYGPCLLVNATDSRERRNFTLAHEYGHLLLDAPGSLCDTEDHADERAANRFAAALLMPAGALQADAEAHGVPARPQPSDLKPMARRWHVSVHALAIRLEEIGVLGKGTTLRLESEAPEKPWFPPTKGPAWRRRLRQLGTTYVSLALEAHRHGELSLGALADHLRVTIRQARELLETARVE